ncbi:MAG: SUMF1/EgtB/PvdO family nonheme iron enzyme [Nitrospirae bacterium]|nr:SUMF1/EgtB/PvdO family nonheme iron enzyme [Nitrospirota bacterium]
MFWTKTSVSKEWVIEEAEEGKSRNILIPVLMDQIGRESIPLGFRQRQWADLTGWHSSMTHQGFQQFVAGISRIAGPPSAQSAQGIQNRPGNVQEKALAKPIAIEHMVLVPKGSFKYGDERNLCPLNYDYYIDIYPVTNEQFKKFIEAGGYMMKQEHWSEEGWKWRKKNKVTQPCYWDDPGWTQPDHPVVGVSWYEAEAYAKSVGKRLPTEQEWEKAARGTDGRIYPWGDEFDKEKCNSGASGIGRTTLVTKYVNGLSPYGCYDMAGNVWVWTSSVYDNSGQYKVLRGGSWNLYAYYLRATYRNLNEPTDRIDDLGFRCLMALRRREDV